MRREEEKRGEKGKEEEKKREEKRRGRNREKDNRMYLAGVTGRRDVKVSLDRDESFHKRVPVRDTGRRA